LVRSELRKITSTRLWWALLLGALVFSALQSGVTAAFAGLESAGPGAPGMPGPDTAEGVRSIYPMAMFTGTYILALVLGITGMTGEYRYQTITATFLVTPRRPRVVVAKILAHMLMGLLYGVLATVVVLVVGGTVLALRGHGLGWGADRLWPTVLLAIIAVAVWTVLGIGLGTLIRSQIAAIVVGILVTFLIEPLLTVALSAADLDWLVKWLPSNASSALMQPGDVLLDHLDWWLGGLVLLGYGLVLAAVGVVLSVRRDVS
jgi:ABC-type transport system involved in multi-copper enzyme maturation permease subunit